MTINRVRKVVPITAVMITDETSENLVRQWLEEADPTNDHSPSIHVLTEQHLWILRDDSGSLTLVHPADFPDDYEDIDEDDPEEAVMPEAGTPEFEQWIANQTKDL